MTLSNLRINAARLLSNFAELAKIGGTPEGGVNRLAFSEEDMAARAWFEAKVKSLGFDYYVDGAGNQSACYAAPPGSKKLIIGSHLDTVANGGRFDGALGVLVAIEAAETLRENGVVLPFDLEIINFTDEEGTVMGEFGSHALTGALNPSHFENPRGGRAALEAGMARLGITPESAMAACREPSDILGFLELHIEQGMRLKEMGLDIGVVTGIVGIRSAWLTFGGKANHAGTTPMGRRQDALWGAADFISRSRDLIVEKYQPGVVTCGQIASKPAAFNIVPSEVTFSLEFRHGSEELLEQMTENLRQLADEIAAVRGLTFGWQTVTGCAAAPSAEPMMAAIEAGADSVGLEHRRMLSFAGHDTQMMAHFVPSAMYFVPSEGGISHNPAELTLDQDVINGGNVMLQSVVALIP